MQSVILILHFSKLFISAMYNQLKDYVEFLVSNFCKVFCDKICHIL
jgi:hypothetical protein